MAASSKDAANKDTEEEGASFQELIIEACRRDNVALLEEVLNAQMSHQAKANLINNTKDGIGNHCLHVAASYGNYDIMEELLDQEGVEVDPVDRMEGDTPLHSAVRYVNKQDKADWKGAQPIVEILIEAGSDPKSKNKAKLKAVELVDPRNKELRSFLNKAEFAQHAGNDIIDDSDDGDGPTGSASDSD
ncbi:hypothetical protein MMC30_005752 [Trapelia coarctata]|nr:hypothetical protein [Trapelia coarctata]